MGMMAMGVAGMAGGTTIEPVSAIWTTAISVGTYCSLAGHSNATSGTVQSQPFAATRNGHANAAS